MTTERTGDLSVLILSCDRNHDLWELFFALFKKHWPDCSFPLYLGSTTRECDNPMVRTLCSTIDPNWAESTKIILDQVPTEYVMVFLDDYFLLDRVDDAAIRRQLAALETLGGAYLRLDPAPPPDRAVSGFPEIGAIDRDAPYRCSLHIAIWKTSVLRSLLKDGESIWEMEIAGSARSAAMETGFYATWKSAIRYDMNGVVQGVWHPATLRIAARERIEIRSTRGVMNRRQVRQRSISQLARKIAPYARPVVPLLVRDLARRMLRRLGLIPD